MSVKPEPKTALGRWMRENRHTDQSFADLVGDEMIRLGSSKSVTPTAVRKWRLCRAIPRNRSLLAISKVTGGSVTFDSFLQEIA